MDDRELGNAVLLDLLKVITVSTVAVDRLGLVLDQDVMPRGKSTIRGGLFERCVWRPTCVSWRGLTAPEAPSSTPRPTIRPRRA